MSWIQLITILTIPLSVSCLNCYICGDNNLDEFGECSTQFQYDCSSYAARFSADERMYCRTTRHRAPNNTYTVMKECISEKDHYRTFPEKGYQLDEECDLIDVQGDEVAYCLCRHNDLCNKSPIAEQFMAFEEKHPELFGDLEPAQPHAPSIPTGNAPLSLGKVALGQTFSGPGSGPRPPAAAFGAPRLTPPAIVPVNDPRFSLPVPSNTNTETESKSQLPSRPELGSHQSETESNQAVANVPDISITTDEMPKTLDNGDFLNIPIPPVSRVSQGEFVGTIGANKPGPPNTISSAPAGLTSLDKVKKGQLRCNQCGQVGLPNEDSDCNKQIEVECQENNSVCFTRQILLEQGQSAVEKMCASLDAIRTEFGSSKSSCGTASEGRVRFCSCNTNNCNRLPIALQMAKETSMSSFAKSSDSDQHHLSGSELLAGNQAGIAEIPQSPTFGTSKSKHENVAKDDVEKSQNEGIFLREPLPSIPKQPQSAPIVPLVTTTKAVVHCAACNQMDINDPTEDCRSSVPMPCAKSDGGEILCLTKQTQMTNSVFSMEKRCISSSEFTTLFPGETLQMGCAMTKTGLMNYCLCSGDMCNKDGLLQQAQLNGVRESLQTNLVAVHPSKVPESIPPKLSAPHIPPPVFLDADEPPNFLDNNLHDIGLSNEERDLLNRRRQWAEADLKSYRSVLSYFWVFITVTYLFT